MGFPDPPKIFGLTESELIEIGLSKVATLSDGKLNDRSVVGALYHIVAAEAAQIAQYGSTINQIPANVIQQWLVMAGVRRLAAQRTIVPVTIALTQLFPDTKTIPVGFQASVGSIRFELTADVDIPPGVATSQGAEAFMQSIDSGSNSNISAGAQWTIITPLSFVASITNGDPVQYGAEIESEDALIDRAIRAIRGNSLVSDDDFEDAAVEFLGESSAALSIPLLGQDKATYEAGAVHVFILDAGGATPTQARMNAVQVELTKRSLLRLVYISPMDVVNVQVRVIADLRPGFDQQATADEIRSRLKAYLSPGNLTPGESLFVNEIEFQTRSVAGVGRVASVSLASGSDVPRRLDMQLAFRFSTARLSYCSVTLIQSSAEVYVKEFTTP